MKLLEFINIKNGKSRPMMIEGGKYPVYGANGVIGFSNQWNTDAESIIIGRVGSFCGSIYYSDKKAWATDNSMMVTNQLNADSKYLFYMFQTLGLNSRASGSGQPLLNQFIINSIEYNLPPLPEQKRIANILSSFDNKIELLREQNKTLENIAQTIFKQWFIDFNFPDSNGKPYKDNGGKMRESDLELIPEGWEIISLKEIISLRGGFAHNTKLKGKPKTKIAKMGVVNGENFFNRSSVIDYAGEIDNKYLLTPGDLLICTRDVTRDKIVIGNVARIPEDLAEYGLYAGSNTWIIKTDYSKDYLYLLFRSKNFRKHIIRVSKGSTIVMITQDSFLNYKFCKPDNKTLGKFSNIVNKILSKIQLNIVQELNLLKIEEILLSKLIN